MVAGGWKEEGAESGWLADYYDHTVQEYIWNSSVL